MSPNPAPLGQTRIGDLSVSYLPDGHFRIRPRDQFSGGDHRLWEESEPSLLDSQGFMVLSLGATLIRSDSRNILVDTGFGTSEADIGELTDGAREGFMLSGALLDNLAAQGLDPTDIDMVCFTHLHCDHTGWLGSRSSPTFPKARYLVAREEWEYWTSVESDGSAAGPSEEQLRLLDGNVEFLEDDPAPTDGVSFIRTGGHTPGHCIYVLTDGEERLLILGDAFHSSLELSHPELAFNDDVDPVVAAQARGWLRRELARPGTSFLAGHFSDDVLGCIAFPRPALSRENRSQRRD